MNQKPFLRQSFRSAELIAVVLTIALLPVDRFPYIHATPLYLGAISFGLLVFVTSIRLLRAAWQRRWQNFRRYGIVALLFALPVIGYAQSISYAIDKPYAAGATKLLAIVAIKAFCLFILIGEKPELWKIIRKSIYAVTALVVAFGFYQFIFDVFGASPKLTDLRDCCTSNSTYIYPRVHSVSIEPLYLANFLLLPFWLLTYELYRFKSARKNKYLIILFGSTLALIILTTSRSAYLSLVLALVVFSVGLKGKALKKLAKKGAKILLAALAAAIILVMLSGLASLFINKTPINGADSGIVGSLQIFGAHSVNVLDESAQTRYGLWPKAIELIKENPLKGVGAYNSRVALHLDEYNKGVPDIKLQPFNNDFLGILVDLGLIGVLTFGPILIFILGIIYRLFKRSWAHPATPLALAFIGMLVQSNFFHSILLARFWVVVGLLFALYYFSKDSNINPA